MLAAKQMPVFDYLKGSTAEGFVPTKFLFEVEVLEALYLRWPSEGWWAADEILKEAIRTKSKRSTLWLIRVVDMSLANFLRSRSFFELLLKTLISRHSSYGLAKAEEETVSRWADVVFSASLTGSWLAFTLRTRNNKRSTFNLKFYLAYLGTRAKSTSIEGFNCHTLRRLSALKRLGISSIEVRHILRNMQTVTSTRVTGVLKLPTDALSTTSPDAHHAISDASKVTEATSTRNHRQSLIDIFVVTE
ncbi:hypothetical protein EVAR_53491_1 [Eumeta japonica]|uniref:Uncharacterized protein n=1 Tax=Eumeta variegata TaxID=151549 RepID=A0A4C1YUT6_EUMVA|nr:hypothetical protein EVAR_53491_1 [Eumeta japonica]